MMKLPNLYKLLALFCAACPGASYGGAIPSLHQMQTDNKKEEDSGQFL